MWAADFVYTNKLALISFNYLFSIVNKKYLVGWLFIRKFATDN